MRTAIVSDIHDNLWNLAPALYFISDCDDLICCGDLCSPFVIDELRKFGGPVHILLGNNDADLMRITRKSDDRVRVEGEFFEAEFGGLTFGVNHFDSIARPIAHSGLYDVVCYGHNHRVRAVRLGNTLAINPGAIMGAAFGARGWEDVPATFAIYSQREISFFEVKDGAVTERSLTIETAW